MTDESTFRCWDPLGGEREHGRLVQAHSPLDAAEWFADHDIDIYEGDGHPVAVEDDTGEVSVYMVAWVDHPERWQEPLAELVSTRATRLVLGPERDFYLRGEVPRVDRKPAEMRAELAEALGVDDANGVWLWDDLLDRARRDHRLAKALPMKPADVEEFGVTRDRLDAWLESNGWVRVDDGKTAATVWRSGETTVVAWDGDSRSIATAINTVAKRSGLVPHDVLVSVAAVRVESVVIEAVVS